MVGLIVPSNDENLLSSTGTAAQSPFVIAASRAGVAVVPSIISKYDGSKLARSLDVSRSWTPLGRAAEH